MEQLTMSNREIDKLKVIQNVIDGVLTWPQAAEILSVSERHIGRLCAKIRKEGNRGIIHGLKGQPSNHQLAAGLVDKALGHVKAYYSDFGPTFANEKLWENHGIRISTNTLRKAMISEGLYVAKPYKPKHRKWRERRACVGMLVQLDGSEHAWFEGRGPKCALLIFIDDATSRILYGRFVTVEDTANLMACAKAYLKRHGRPVAFYVDKDSIYKVNRQASIDEELRDETPLSQFTRGMGELDVEMIFANSPQAKGRVERGFRTHQDRLVKELRLAGVCDMDAGNKFLNVYIPKHNKKFAVAPASPADAHRALLRTHRLDEILCSKLSRTVGKDYTLRYNNKFLQLAAEQAVRVRPGALVTVEEHLDGSLHLKLKGAELRFKQVEKRPYTGYYARNRSELNAKGTPPKQQSVPRKDNPWRRFKLPGSMRTEQRTPVAATGHF
jgi:hypothetical protein